MWKEKGPLVLSHSTLTFLLQKADNIRKKSDPLMFSGGTKREYWPVRAGQIYFYAPHFSGA